VAQVTLLVGGRQHSITCRDGSEERVRRMGAMIDTRWAAANQASGGLNAERTMLLIALMLADSLDEAEQGRTTAPQTPISAAGLLSEVAARLEAVADALENPSQSA